MYPPLVTPATQPLVPAHRRGIGHGPTTTRCVVMVEAGADGRNARDRARRDCDDVCLLEQRPDEGLREFFGRVWLRMQGGDTNVLSIACSRLGSTKLRSLLLTALTRANVARRQHLLVRLHCAVSEDEALPMWVPEVAERLVDEGLVVEIRFDRTERSPTTSAVA